MVFGGSKAIFLGCDVDGNWSQIGEVCHPGYYSKELNQYVSSLLYQASFNASRQYALSLDTDNNAIISGYDDQGSWVVKTEIKHCSSNAQFSPSGRKLLALLLNRQDCDKTADPVDQGQPPEHTSHHQGFIKRTYGNFKLWDCSSPGDRLDNAQTLEHSGANHGIFSPSENFLLSYGTESNGVCIWGYNEEGNLVEKARVSHPVGIIDAAFNAQEDSVLTRSNGNVVKIQSLDSQGKWQEQLEVEHQRHVYKARFSRSGHLAYTFSLNTACILGRDNNGKWIKQAMTNLVNDYSIEGADFNGLENHFLIYGNKLNRKDKHQPGLVQIWGIGDDGQWAKREQINLDHSVKSAKFSPDDDLLLIQCNNDRNRLRSSKKGTVLLWKMPVGPE
ncbi:WD40 repeat domain-containing protein [Endozoicomonas sp. ONNA2]|uniref:WD40 repeat domain-containing protein n=1 Tax=Endozoicomonas sp. ONNA2 TaxID=2828741 RepID=UPI0021477675|nr:WD40 repeat domain-containing protein [Endozoicomonas sp. ONNA2]